MERQGIKVIVWQPTDILFRLVRDHNEWKYLRKIHNVRGGVENRLIAERSDGIAEVYLLPNETLAIPFVFQSFCSGLVAAQESEEITPVKLGNTHERGISARTIHVRFLMFFNDSQGVIFKF